MISARRFDFVDCEHESHMVSLGYATKRPQLKVPHKEEFLYYLLYASHGYDTASAFLYYFLEYGTNSQL